MEIVKLFSIFAGSLCKTVEKYDILFNEEFSWDMKQVLKVNHLKLYIKNIK